MAGHLRGIAVSKHYNSVLRFIKTKQTINFVLKDVHHFSHKKPISFLMRKKHAARFTVAGACISTVSSVFAYNLLTSPVHAESEHPISRSVKGALELSNVKFTLYQFQSCPYCCKVRATLDYYGFPYDVVEVNSITKAQLKFSKYKKVPVLVADGTNFGEKYQLLKVISVNCQSIVNKKAEFLCMIDQHKPDIVQFYDSSLIVSVLGSFVYDQTQTLRDLHRFYPGYQEKEGRKMVWKFPNKYFVMYAENIADNRAEKERREERRWRRWTDEKFMHTISPNVYKTMKESFEAFKHFSDWGEWEKNFSGLTCFFLVNVGAIAMYVVGGIVKRRHNISPNPRESLHDACDDWIRNLGERQFVGGDAPNLADLSMYGAMNSFNNCTAFNELMKDHEIKHWFIRMDEQIRNHKGSEIFQVVA